MSRVLLLQWAAALARRAAVYPFKSGIVPRAYLEMAIDGLKRISVRQSRNTRRINFSGGKLPAVLFLRHDIALSAGKNRPSRPVGSGAVFAIEGRHQNNTMLRRPDRVHFFGNHISLLRVIGSRQFKYLAAFSPHPEYGTVRCLQTD